MQEGLQTSQATAGRLQVFIIKGIGVIDDTYNANPDSVRAALNVLSDLGEEKTIAVLGDMLELGQYAEEAHRSIGRYMAEKSIGSLVTVGELAGFIAEEAGKLGIDVYPCSDHQEALRVLKRLNPDSGWVILVKGSRGMQMEIIVQGLLGQEGAGSQ
jgi:UDP-N-acetylmuramoyl-tripeptide--D-alanyl-D-alanine ligase